MGAHWPGGVLRRGVCTRWRRSAGMARSGFGMGGGPRGRRIGLIARIGQIITADLRLEDLLQSAADTMHELLGYPNVAIPLILPDDPDTLVLTTVGGDYKRIVKGEYRIPITQGIMGAAARERQP